MDISYYGHYMVMDKDLRSRIIIAFRELLPQDDTFNFYFYQDDQLSSCIHAAVEDVKAERKDLNIKTIMVVSDPYAAVEKDEFDEIAVAPNVTEDVGFLANFKRAEKWVINRADYLFMYLYPDICDGDQSLLAFIQKQVRAGKLFLLDLTNDEITSIINEQVPKLRERLKYVNQEIKSGRTFKELAEEMAVKPERVKTLYNDSRRELRLLTYRATRDKRELANE